MTWVTLSFTPDAGFGYDIEFGLTTKTGAPVTVTNASPTIDGAGRFSVRVDTPLTEVFATFADPGAGDTHTAMIDWGDGSTSTATVDQDAQTISGTPKTIPPSRIRQGGFGIALASTTQGFPSDNSSRSCLA